MEPPKTKVVSFVNKELPGYFDVKNPVPAAQRLAQEKFGFKDEDFVPTKLYGCGGFDHRGYHFEVEVTARAARMLGMLDHPDVLLISDPLPPHDFKFGALDPKDLPPQAKKKPGGPKI